MKNLDENDWPKPGASVVVKRDREHCWMVVAQLPNGRWRLRNAHGHERAERADDFEPGRTS